MDANGFFPKGFRSAMQKAGKRGIRCKDNRKRGRSLHLVPRLHFGLVGLRRVCFGGGTCASPCRPR